MQQRTSAKILLPRQHRRATTYPYPRHARPPAPRRCRGCPAGRGRRVRPVASNRQRVRRHRPVCRADQIEPSRRPTAAAIQPLKTPQRRHRPVCPAHRRHVPATRSRDRPHPGWADLRVAASSSRGAPPPPRPSGRGPSVPLGAGAAGHVRHSTRLQSSVGAPAAGAGRGPTPPPPPPRASVRGRNVPSATTRHSTQGRAGTAAWPDGEGAGARPVRRPPRRWAVARRRSRLRAAPSPSPSACAAPNAAGAGRQADRDSIVREPSWTRRVASVPEGPGL